ncbi:uncharacterized protein LOC115618845 [Strigops habroptila]|uniref:uncharacterized protein LOC115618845 n=1 Tax=Strigops habroptila TaxID=2489341 RepID=UPI0011CEECBA|nr:uncharacterized protein LOC115618845 [Strigops habroptila]
MSIPPAAKGTRAGGASGPPGARDEAPASPGWEVGGTSRSRLCCPIGDAHRNHGRKSSFRPKQHLEHLVEKLKLLALDGGREGPEQLCSWHRIPWDAKASGSSRDGPRACGGATAEESPREDKGSSMNQVIPFRIISRGFWELLGIMGLEPAREFPIVGVYPHGNNWGDPDKNNPNFGAKPGNMEQTQKDLETLRKHREALWDLKASGERRCRDYLARTELQGQALAAEFRRLRRFLRDRELRELLRLRELQRQARARQGQEDARIRGELGLLQALIGAMERQLEGAGSVFLQGARSAVDRYVLLQHPCPMGRLMGIIPMGRLVDTNPMGRGDGSQVSTGSWSASPAWDTGILGTTSCAPSPQDVGVRRVGPSPTSKVASRLEMGNSRRITETFQDLEQKLEVISRQNRVLMEALGTFQDTLPSEVEKEQGASPGADGGGEDLCRSGSNKGASFGRERVFPFFQLGKGSRLRLYVAAAAPKRDLAAVGFEPTPPKRLEP